MVKINNEKSGIWYLKNLTSGTQIEITDEGAARDFLASIVEAERKNWCLKFEPLQSFAKETIMPMDSVEKYIDSKSGGKRAHPRVDKTFKIIVISGQRVFRTQCANISLGGLLLTGVPPRDFQHEELKIIIQSKDGNMNVLSKARFVDGEAQKRLQFVEMTEQSQIELSKWFEQEGASVAFDGQKHRVA